MVFEYAPALESTKILNLKSNYQLFIGGKFVKSNGGKSYKTIKDRKSTRLNSSHSQQSRMPSSA